MLVFYLLCCVVLGKISFGVVSDRISVGLTTLKCGLS